MTGPSFPGAVEPVLYTHEYTSFMTTCVTRATRKVHPLPAHPEVWSPRRGPYGNTFLRVRTFLKARFLLSGHL